MYFQFLETLLKQYSWSLDLIFMILVAYFTAATTNTFIGYALAGAAFTDAGLQEQLQAQNMSQNKARPLANNNDNKPAYQNLTITALAERNLFALKRENLNPTAASNALDGQVDLLGDNFEESQLQPCTLTLSLRATLVASEKEWSLALMYNNSDQTTNIYNLRDTNKLADDATLVDIRKREIVVKRKDHFERCYAEGESGSTAPKIAVTDNVPKPATGETADKGGGVKRLGEGQYEIERNELNRTLANLNEVATQARMVPEMRNGQSQGFKMFSIKPGSIYDKIGLENGDVIRKINGYEMNSPDKALEVYQKLRDSTAISIELERRGQILRYSYGIR